MRFFAYLLLTLLWFGFNVAAQQPDYLVRDEAQAPEKGSVRGITRIAGPVHEPLGDVTLQWYSVQGDQSGEVRSDAMGRYAIMGLEPGQYRLHVYRKGMIPKRNLMISILPDKATEYDVALQPEEKEMPAEVERDSGSSGNPQPDLRRELEHLRGRLGRLDEDAPDARRIRDRIGEIEWMLRSPEGRDQEGPRRRPESADRDEVDERTMQLRHRMGEGQRRGATQKPARSARMPRMQQELAIFALEHVPAEHAAEIVSRFTGERSIVVGDPWSNTLFVKTGTPYLQDIQRILEHLDVPRRFHEVGWHPEHSSEEADWDHRAEIEEEIEPRGERDVDAEHHAEQDEDATVRLTLRPSDEGEPQLFMGDRPISLDELEERLAHLDDPRSWRLKIQVFGKMPEDALHKVVAQIKELARAKRIEQIEIRAIQRAEKPSEERDEE